MQVFAQGKARPTANGSKPKLSPQQGAFVKQMVRIMKLTAILLTMAFLQVHAIGVAQPGTVTFSGREVSLEKVFSIIKKQTGYSFFYYAEQLQQAKKVTINVKNATIEDVLAMCLKDQPFDYSIKGKTIFIIQKQVKAVTELKPAQTGDPATAEVKGRITNAAGEPLSGANVVIKRTGKGTQANANGEFTLKNVDADEALTISYTGYAPQTIKIGGRTNLILVMQLAENELDETVIQAYGTTTRRLATGNITKVTTAEIERQPVMNPLLALQGKVAGLDVTQTNGFASAPIKVELRGRNTINPTFTTDPLYIIDGVPLTVLELSGLSGYAYGTGFTQTPFTGPAKGQSPFFSINPADIESIEVLKDADATAIYGSRGANGVILITTKKGKAGKTKFDLHVQTGVSKVTRFWNMMNTPQYITMRIEALKNDGITPSLAHGDYDLLQWDTAKYTDWQREIYGGSGQTIDAQAALSGGDARTNFRIGTGFNRTTNILSVNGADQRGSLSTSMTRHTLDQRFSITLSSSYSITQSDMIYMPAAVTLAPNAPSIYDSAGNLNYVGWGSVARSSYPFISLKQPYTSLTNFLNSNLVINYQLINGLKLSTSFGYNISNSNNKVLYLIASKDPLTNPKGENRFGYSTNKNWIIEPQATYDAFIGKGKINVMIGLSTQHTNTSGLLVSGSGYTSDVLIESLSSAPTNSVNDSYGKYKYCAIFGRVTYNWKNKYILNLNSRRDGSSRFGEGKQFGSFGSIGAAWIFTEAIWIKKYFPFLSFGKLRGSYGTTGSDAIGDYKYLTRWSAVGSSDQTYTGSQPLIPQQHANPNYQWQVNKKVEGAIDIGFFNDRLNLSVVYYQNRCGNQLVQFPTPVFTGFSSVAANSPALVQNDGWEYVVAAKLINDKSFKLSINLNTSINRNKLLAYPNIDQSPYANTLVVGKSLNIVKLLNYRGIDPLTGNYSFEDKNNDGVIQTNINSSANDFFDYNLSPNFIGGMGLNFNYKNLQLNLFFSIKKQLGLNAFSSTASMAGGISNQPIEILGKEWKKIGDVDVIAAKYTTQPPGSNYYFQASNGVYTDASFIRLSNLSLSFNLPEQWSKKASMQSCNLFIHANNLFCDYKL